MISLMFNLNFRLLFITFTNIPIYQKKLVMACILLHRNIKKDFPKMVLRQFSLPVSLSHFQQFSIKRFIAVLNDVLPSSLLIFFTQYAAPLSDNLIKVFSPPLKAKSTWIKVQILVYHEVALRIMLKNHILQKI